MSIATLSLRQFQGKTRNVEGRKMKFRKFDESSGRKHKEVEVSHDRLYEEELRLLRQINAEVVSEIDCKNKKLHELERNSVEKTVDASRLVKALIEKINFKDEIINSTGRTVRSLIVENGNLRADFGAAIMKLQSGNFELISKLERPASNLKECQLQYDLKQREQLRETVKLKGKLKHCEEIKRTTDAEMSALKKELEEKSKALQELENLNNGLTVKELKAKQMLKGVREESENLQGKLKHCEETKRASDAQLIGMTKVLEEKTKALQDLENLNKALTAKELMTRQGLEEVRKESVNLQGKLKHCQQTKRASDAQLIGMTKVLEEKTKALHDLEKLNKALTAKELRTRQGLEEVHEESVNLKRMLETYEEAKRAAVAQVKEKTQELEQKTENLEFMESLNQVLTFKESRVTKELNGARKESINGLSNELNDRTILKIKRMGEVDQKAFLKACAQKFPHEDLPFLAAKFCSEWQAHVGCPAWHPFKRAKVHGILQEIVDEDDEKLKELRNELGEVAYDAVATALVEMNEYNASGRYVVPEIWNSKKQQRATMEEIIKYLIQQLKSRKRKSRF